MSRAFGIIREGRIEKVEKVEIVAVQKEKDLSNEDSLSTENKLF